MSQLPVDFLEDRKLRDAARRVVSADVAQVKASLAEQSVLSRLTQTMGGTVRRRIVAGARDVAEFAKVQAKERPGMLAALGATILGALAVWSMRRPAAGPSESEMEGASAETAALPPDEAPSAGSPWPLPISQMSNSQSR